MWRYVSSDELYHHGVLGMKWGIRKSRGSAAKKAAKKKAFVKDNDDRVKTYGKKWVRRADMMTMGLNAYGTAATAKIITAIGAQMIRADRAVNGQGTMKQKAIGAASLAALGLTIGVGAKNTAKLAKDIKLTNEYDYRQSRYKAAKTRAKNKRAAEKEQKAYATK